MPKPKLLDYERKNFMLRVRFREIDKKNIMNLFKRKGYKTLSEYIRFLIRQDVLLEREEIYNLITNKNKNNVHTKKR
jgi:hypothetical protein